MENFIHTFQVDPKVCDQLIEYHQQAGEEYRHEGRSGQDGSIIKDVKESVDVSFFNSSNHPAVRNYFNELQKGFNEYTDKFNLQHMNLITEYCHLIQYYPPGGGYKVWHWERDNGNYDRQLVYMTYLNDVTDGGGTEWYHQDYQSEAKKGLSLIWPADFTHVHKGIVSPTQEKYIVTGWFVYKK